MAIKATADLDVSAWQERWRHEVSVMADRFEPCS